MRRPTVVLYICITILTIPTTGWSKGETVKIVIAGDNISSPIEITSPEILRQFNIWNGPGVGTRGPDGVSHPPAYLDPKRSAGRFIDWPKGMAARPAGLRRFEVTFHIGVPRDPNTVRKYVFAYEVDTLASHGYIYLPRWMNDLISHGVEGNWFYASKRWDELIMPAIHQASEITSDASSREKFSCVFVTAKITSEGAIELYRRLEDGNTRLNYRYPPTSELYDSVKEHIGDVEPGEEIEVSCWPSRS